MNLSFALLAMSVASAEAVGSDSRMANLRRKLSFQKVAGYSPGSQVTDHCAIDLDQAAIESQLIFKTPESFQNARNIYNKGGNSKSYALINVTNGLTSALTKGESILGKNAEGLEIRGKAYQDYVQGATQIKVQYATTDIQDNYVECQVGALVETNMVGCFVDNGAITIGSDTMSYIYTPATDNKNGRTIAGFSTSAKDKMRLGCKGCPYTDFGYFYDYYGTDEYAHQFVEAAFEGKTTQFNNGNADFSRYDYTSKGEFIKKATAYLNTFMYVIREWEDALDDCERTCMNCNDGSVHAWDEGVCFYTGSIEGLDGKASGKLLHELADKRCANFKTCGVEGFGLAGQSKLNYDMFSLFAVGNYQIQSGNCPAARRTTKQIISKMYIPMIQGTLRYAFKVGQLSGGDKEKAEGAVFAAAVLPRIHAANPAAAETIYQSMKVEASSTDFAAVKGAFESAYEHMGITCGEVGGLWSDVQNNYYTGMEPCAQTVSSLNTSAETETNNTLAIALGCTFGGLFAVAAAMVLYMRSKEKQGAPVFKTMDQHEDIKDMN